MSFGVVQSDNDFFCYTNEGKNFVLVAYTCETWSMSQTDEIMIKEVMKMERESDIVNFIKIQRIKWAGLGVRRDENRTTKKSSMPNQFHMKKGQTKS
ncbi:UNVERIFIED_CONTAM: hypothetical protein NCL1_18118 [Trichonephila clavipes]